MSIELINIAINKGAKLYPNVSGGKDGQAMVKTFLNSKLPIEGLVHADLGRVEWHESLGMCEKLAAEASAPLHVVRHAKGWDLIDRWKDRMEKMKATEYWVCDVISRETYQLPPAPFWSSSSSRYCTSDMKRGPIDKFYRNCGNDFIISCEGIRAGESKKREQKIPLTIRTQITSTYYDGMTVEEAIAAYAPGKRLALTWYPVFNYTIDDVWQTYGHNAGQLLLARVLYKKTGKVSEWWSFHPAYVYGNDRVSCVFCILGCNNDLAVGAKHRPELLDLMIEMEEEGKATFKNNFSLKELLQ